MLQISVNGKALSFQTKQFSGGEEHIVLEDITNNMENQHIKIHALIRSSSKLMQLLLLVDAIKRRFSNIVAFELELPYIPYARQDRQCNLGEAFSLKVLAQLINQCGFSRVYVDDPHSDVAPALLDNCVIRSQHELIMAHCNVNSSFLSFVQQAQLVSPDAGSNKKMLGVCQALHKESFIRADKVRDTSTGRISETLVYSDSIDSSVLIVDDICDGGHTFTALAQVLKDKGATQVGLYVTHGIFSKGKESLIQAGIDNIFSFHDWTKF